MFVSIRNLRSNPLASVSSHTCFLHEFNFPWRYLAVTQPLIYSRRRRSKRLAGLMIVAVWVLAGAIASPPLLGCFPRATERDSKKCTYNMDSSYVIFSAMGSFFLPMLVMLYVYGRISCVIASRHRNLEATESENIRPRRNVLVSTISGFVMHRHSTGHWNMTLIADFSSVENSFFFNLADICSLPRICFEFLNREESLLLSLCILMWYYFKFLLFLDF